MHRFAVHETGGLLAALDDDGYAFVPAVLSSEQCDSARRKIDALEPIHWDEVHAGSHLGATGRFLDRYLCVFNRDPYWLQFLDRAGIIELAEAALGSDCHVIGMTAWRTYPGFKAEPLHVDYSPFKVDPESGQTARPFIVTVHFYLSDVTPEVGPTRVVRASHRTSLAPHEPSSVEDVIASAGDVLVFRSDVWHAGSDNRSAHAVRYLLQVHYGRREIAQHFSPFLEWKFNEHVLAAASKRQRRLLGDHEPGAYD